MVRQFGQRGTQRDGKKVRLLIDRETWPQKYAVSKAEGCKINVGATGGSPMIVKTGRLD
jgi:hypothetical protein